MSQRFLTALPVFNEAASVNGVLDKVLGYSPNVLVVDDGSTDGTSDILAARSNDIRLIRHASNQGYGAALITAFRYASQQDFEYVVTIDCDGQHEPLRIPRFVQACKSADIVSGSRYLKQYPKDSEPPAQRRFINHLITSELNECLQLGLTDAFCGFKSYRVAALNSLNLTEPGYGMPLELWVEAAAHNLQILEVPVPLIYLDDRRSFGGALDDAETRLDYYRDVICRSLRSAERRLGFVPSGHVYAERLGCS